MSSRFALPLTGSTGPGFALPAQTRLEAYEVEALVAQSRFALVYRAVHPATQQVVAIKEYFPEAIALRHPTHRVTPRSSSGSERFAAGRRAFVIEARSLARFEHPSLVRVQGLFEANGTAYRVMRFTPGPTLLAHRQALGRMPAVEDFRCWVDGLLGALATLHHAGCVHGAVSPANILLRPGERPLLLGFDAVRNALAPARRPGTVQPIDEVRTPSEGRAPPASFTAGTEADLRGLAATLRYCIEGRAPAAESLADAWQREGGPVPIPQDIVRLLCSIDATLSDDANERPQSVAEFRRRLEKAGAPGPLRVIAAAIARDEVRLAPAPDADIGSPSAGDALQDTRADQRAGEDRSTGRDPSPVAAPLPRDDLGSGHAAEPEPEAAAEATFEAAGEGPSEVSTEVPAEVEAEVAARIEPEVEPAAEGQAEAEVDETPRSAADNSAPTATLDELPCVPPAPVSNPAASATDDLAMQPLDENRTPGVPEAISTSKDAAANRTFQPRRTAAAMAVAASVVLAIGVTVWDDRQVESHPPPQPAHPPETQLAATPRADTAELVPGPTAVPAPVPVSMATHEAGSQRDAVTPAPVEAPPALVRPKQPSSPPVAKAPAAPRKVVVAAKARSPNEACEGRKGFALYQCMQLQCRKAASSDHADCASLR